jgi:hypothetical protein
MATVFTVDKYTDRITKNGRGLRSLIYAEFQSRKFAIAYVIQRAEDRVSEAAKILQRRKRHLKYLKKKLLRQK